jgi:D-glycero-D-manno-heptose 1,7-bisphosphate phosphatase|tara:strand:- start:622 stop:1215 length:594 start_codon:yes stop_codon:yes gene_type:complete
MGRFKQTNNLISNFNNCVVGLDRDGVINTDLGTYITRKQDFIPIEHSLKAVALIRSKGHKIVIITNQGGIIKNELTEQQVESVHAHMFELLGQAGCSSIDGLYYSSSSQKQDLMAKPNIGMFERAQDEIPNLKFSKGFYVGDKLSDLKAAYKIGARPILVRTGHGLETEKTLKKFTYQKIAKRTKIYNNLWEFAQAL